MYRISISGGSFLNFHQLNKSHKMFYGGHAKSCSFLYFFFLSKCKTLLDPNLINQGLRNRLGVWKSAIDIVKERPFIGYGKVNPHNLMLQIIFEIGLIIFLWLWITVIIEIIKLGFLNCNPVIEIRNFAKFFFKLFYLFVVTI